MSATGIDEAVKRPGLSGGATGRPKIDRKPRLLFLAYDFPPINNIGCVRAFNVAKWLTRLGWEVTVVTPLESAWRQKGSAEELHDNLSRLGIRCMRTEHRWRSLLPTSDRRDLAWAAGGVTRRIAAFAGIERETGWIREAEKACLRLDPSDVDVVFASAPPFAAFGLAQRVAERLERPFVMDYRDLWSGNPHARHASSSRKAEGEKRVLAASAAVTGVSTSLRESLRQHFGDVTPIHVISNGFDPEEMANVTGISFDHFSIVYAGAFYPPKRTVEPVMEALRFLRSDDRPLRDWRFHYYGAQGEYVLERARAHGVEDRVVSHGNVPRAEALSAVRGADLAVVISSVYETATLEDKGIVTGKVFEAIGLGTPMLVIAPEGSDLQTVLERTRLGRRFGGDDTRGIAEFLRSCILEQRPGAGDPDVYSWPHIIKGLDEVLRTAAFGQSGEAAVAEATGFRGPA